MISEQFQVPVLPIRSILTERARLRASVFLSCLAVLFLWTPAALRVRAEGALWAEGITQPISDVTMNFPVVGIVGSRFVQDGASVKKGQVIMELDKRLEELEVKRRLLARDLAKNELDRTKALAERNAISVSREELDKKQMEYNIAAVEHELAEEQVRKRQLFAPFDGYISEFHLDVGESCDMYHPVLRMVDTKQCYFVSNVDAKAGYDLKLRQKVKLEIEVGSKSIPIEGVLYFVSPVVDPASGLLKVKVLFENPDGKVRPGVAGRMLLKES